MRRNRHQSQAQLVLGLERANPEPLVERGTKGLVETLADLLLEALGAAVPLEQGGVSTRITPDHLGRAAVVYVRQSTMAQVTGNLESQRRQYDLAGAAEAAGFRSVSVIDDDLGRSGSGSMERPGFERLVAMVCSGGIGAVYCIEASRLARNGRDWHHLIDLCALAGTLVIDPDGAYDPRLVNDRLLLGLKGTVSEYELSLMRQRGIAARDSKAKRGEYRFMLPPGFCWSEAGKIEMDPDEHVADTIRLVFAKFRELGSARQVFLWLRSAGIRMPVVLRNVEVCKLVWKAPAYHSVMQILHNPLYAGAYAFGRKAQRTQITDGRARKTSGVAKRTLFTLDWIDDPELRRAAGHEPNKGETRNSLARAVFLHRLGEIRDRTYENQQHRASGLNLLVTAIILWNTRYLERAVAALRQVEEVPGHLLAHLSPLGWEHVNLTGDYIWAAQHSMSENIGGMRPLRLPPNTLAKAA